MRSLVDRRSGGKKSTSDSAKGSSEKKKKDSKDDNAVIVLTDSNFDNLLKGSKDVWMVKFYGNKI